jgi:hypothetical protein
LAKYPISKITNTVFPKTLEHNSDKFFTAAWQASPFFQLSINLFLISIGDLTRMGFTIHISTNSLSKIMDVFSKKLEAFSPAFFSFWAPRNNN